MSLRVGAIHMFRMAVSRAFHAGSDCILFDTGRDGSAKMRTKITGGEKHRCEKNGMPIEEIDEHR